jgi:hypothetical protein
MRTSLDSKTLGGLLFLLAAFALALPGVKAVRAEEPQAPLAAGDGPSCNQLGPEAGAVQAGASMQEVQARILAQIAAQEGSAKDQPVLLNGRGYNYASGSDVERIAAQARQLERER